MSSEPNNPASGGGDHGRDDEAYLWDPTGPADPELEALERTLERFAYRDRPAPEFGSTPAFGSAPGSSDERPRSSSAGRFLAVLAAALVVGLAYWLFGLSERRPERRVPGMPGTGSSGPVVQVANAAIRIGEQSLAVGDEVQLDDGAYELTEVDDGGPAIDFEVTGPGQVRLDDWSSDGPLSLTITAGSCEVDTAPRDRKTAPDAPGPRPLTLKFPWGTVTSKDGALFASAEAGGDGIVLRGLRGESTVLAADAPDRRLIVPQGAIVQLLFGEVLSLPVPADWAPALRKMLAEYHFAGDDADARRNAVDRLLDACEQPRDTLAIWHLLQDDDRKIRYMAERALMRIAGTPKMVKSMKGAPELSPDEWLEMLTPLWRE